MSIFLALAIFLAAAALQGLFAGYETGFVSANPIRIRYMAEEEGDRRATRLLAMLERPDCLLTSLLIGTNVMVVICTLVVSLMVDTLVGSAMAESAGAHDLARVVENIVSAIIVAPSILIFSEIIPKSVFRTHPNRLALALLPVVSFFHTLFLPLAKPITWVTGLLARSVGALDQHVSPLRGTLEEFRVLVDEGVDHGTIEREEQEMIHSVIDLQTTTAKEIMVPRIHIEALPDTTTREELVDFFAKTGLTRIPVYHETIDEVAGVINAYSLLMDEEPGNQDINRFIQEAPHVPDTIKVGELFRTLKNSRYHLAIVTDEYGGTDGLVTVEDILEEIFGEIQDEYDSEESPIHRVGRNAYSVDARTPLEEVETVIGVAVPDEEVETIGGLAMHVAGHIPAQGEVIEYGRLRMTILAGGPNHVSKLRLEVLPDAAKISPQEKTKESARQEEGDA